MQPTPSIIAESVHRCRLSYQLACIIEVGPDGLAHSVLIGASYSSAFGDEVKIVDELTAYGYLLHSECHATAAASIQEHTLP